MVFVFLREPCSGAINRTASTPVCCGSFLFFNKEERWDNVISEEKKVWAVELLKEKQRETGRQPKKDDFDEVTRSRIKAFLGPWPRALEAAGLKEKKNT